MSEKDHIREIHNKSVGEYFDRQTSFWNLVYGESAEKTGILNNYFMSKRKSIVLQCIDTFSDGRSLRVLDAGCGAGVHILELCRRGHKVAGLDISLNMLREACQATGELSGKPIGLLKGDIERLPFKDGFFDAVLSVGVLQYLQGDDKCLGEFGRVVRKGGIVVVTMPNLLRLFNFTDPYYYFRRGWKYLAHEFHKPGIGTIPPSTSDFSSNEFFRNRRYLYGEWRKFLDKAGLIEKEVFSVGFGPPTFWGKEIVHHQRSIGVSVSLENISRRKGLGSLKVFANRWVILLEKIC